MAAISVIPVAELILSPHFAPELVVEIIVKRRIDEVSVLIPGAVWEANVWVGCLELHFWTTNGCVWQNAFITDPDVFSSHIPASWEVRSVIPVNVASQIIGVPSADVQS